MHHQPPHHSHIFFHTPQHRWQLWAAKNTKKQNLAPSGTFWPKINKNLALPDPEISTPRHLLAPLKTLLGTIWRKIIYINPYLLKSHHQMHNPSAKLKNRHFINHSYFLAIRKSAKTEPPSHLNKKRAPRKRCSPNPK